MKITIYPQSLRGQINIPSSKSYLHRYLILASLQNEPIKIMNPIYGDDIILTIKALQAVGVKFKLTDDYIVVIPPKKWQQPTAPIEVGNSGSTIRLLLFILLYKINRFSVHCTPRLITRLEETGLVNLPIKYFRTNETLNFSGLTSFSEITLTDEYTSQYISGLMMLGTCLDTRLLIKITSDSTRFDPYILMTKEAMETFGYKLITDEVNKSFIINEAVSTNYDNNQIRTYKTILEVEGDYSLASNFLVIGALNERIIIKNLPKDSLQADHMIIDYLRLMKANLAISNNIVTIEKSSLIPITIDLRWCPDLGPLLMGLASVIEGTTTFINYQKLNYKESNRLSLTKQILLSLGSTINETNNLLQITGSNKLHGGVIDCEYDHRIAFMLASIASNLTSKITILNSQSVSKSYPHFWEDFKSLGAMIVEEDNE